MRKTIPVETETELLRLSGRRCCVCFGLHNDFGVKKGQIAHLDHDATNNELGNLAFLCLEHHDDYDSRTSQSKALTLAEIRSYRKTLYSAIQLSTSGDSAAIVATHDKLPIDLLGEKLHAARERFLVWHTWSEYFNPILAMPLRNFLATA